MDESQLPVNIGAVLDSMVSQIAELSKELAVARGQVAALADQLNESKGAQPAPEEARE